MKRVLYGCVFSSAPTCLRQNFAETASHMQPQYVQVPSFALTPHALRQSFESALFHAAPSGQASVFVPFFQPSFWSCSGR